MEKEREGTMIILDDAKIEARAAVLPEEMQEPYRWISVYLREECHRELDVLTKRFEEIGIERDKTTWSKILRGHWNRDANGVPRETPVISMKNFLKEVDRLRRDAQLKANAGKVPFIMTGTAQSIWDYIDLKRAPDRVNKFGVVIGETGSQKTATFREYVTVNNHGTCVWLEAPAKPRVSEFIADLGECYGCPRNSNTARRMVKITESVTDKKTIIVDNVQRLYDPRFEGNQEIFNFLQKLQDKTRCTIILSFTPTFENTFRKGRDKGYFEQFEGRAGGARSFLRLPTHAPEEDVVQIAEAFGLQHAGKHEDYLVAISREPGRIRTLFEALQTAKVLANAASAKLTIDHVREARGED